MQVVVAGAGVAGLAAAGALSREGHDVVLVDPDPSPPEGGAEEVFRGWERPSIGQFQQPHNFLGLGRRVLRESFPEVVEALEALGADEVRMDAFLGAAPREPGDEDLATIACRRPVFDATLRSAVLDRPRVTHRPGGVDALIASAGRVEGVVLADGASISADLVVDASGRGPHGARWLAAAGLPAWDERTAECGLLYYSRHYRLRDSSNRPPYASLLAGPRGDLGCLAYAVFLGDNDTFCVCVMVPTSERVWRGLRDTEAFERVAARIPGVGAWLELAEPFTPVLPMGALRNTLRTVTDGDRPRVPGLVLVGDARCHTNPTFAFGASLGLWQSVELAAAARDATDVDDVAVRLEQRIGADARSRFEAAAAEDADRLRLWSGEPLDVTDRSATMPLFLRAVVARVAASDPELLRAVARRVNGLDPLDALPQRTDLLDRARALYDERRDTFPAPPPKAQLLEALAG